MLTNIFRNHCRSRVVTGLAAIAIVVATSATALALPVLDFTVAPPHPANASVSYAGGAAPLVGANINVTNLIAIDTPLLNGSVHTCFNCRFNFTTGNLISSSNSPGITSWVFGGGGTLTLTGQVVGINGGSVTLLTGVFQGATVTRNTLLNPNNASVSLGIFVDEKNEELLEAFGLPTDVLYNGAFNIGFRMTLAAVAPSGFTSSSVGSGDIENSPVPEPGSLLLLGSGLFGLGYVTRRRKRS